MKAIIKFKEEDTITLIMSAFTAGMIAVSLIGQV